MLIMRSEEIAFEIFAFHWEVLVVIVALYAIPIMRFLTFPFSIGHPLFMRLNSKLGKFEHGVAWFRDTIVVFYLIGVASWNFYFGIRYGWSSWIWLGVGSLLFVILSILNLSWKRKGRRNLLNFVRNYPTIHPSEFFKHLLCAAGGIRHKFPKAPYSTVDPQHLDFRSPKKRKINLTTKLVGVWSTMWLTRLAMFALKWQGRNYLREVASSLAVIWGTRLAFLAQAEVVIKDRERLMELEGLNIYLFNHLSFFDFAMVPLVMAVRAQMSGVGLHDLPRFLLAKSHFLNNPIFYRVLGIGKVAQETGMIFVERRGKEDEAKRAIEEAAQILVHENADIVVFPQGTRAYGRVGPQAERLDPGYYAVGSLSRLKRDGDHLKKGAAHLAINAAQTLLREGVNTDINLIPVAIKGTGVIVPKGSMKIEPNVTIVLQVGEPVIVKGVEVAGIEDSEAYDDFVRRLHGRVDHVLKSTIMVHADLERRFFEDMRTMMEPLYIEEMAIAMKPWRGDDYLIHAILDLIYTCKPKDWRTLLGRLVYLIRSDVSRDELLDFKGEVAEMISSS